MTSITQFFSKVLLGSYFYKILAVILLSYSTIVPAEAQQAFSQSVRVNPYFIVNTVEIQDGTGIEESVISGPPKPPPGFELERQAVSLPEPDSATGINVLTVPAFNWVFGCSAVSGAMIAGYYDRSGFPNMYTGPTNGGVMPLNNGLWPTWSDGYATYPNCPLIASKIGMDGRTSRGSIDDYWVKYGSAAVDPYITGGWAEHTWGDAIGDFMKTSQFVYSNTDGSTSFWNFTSSATPLTCTAMPGYGIMNDGTQGRKQFYEARGYTVTDCYNQATDNTISGGFSFTQFKAEIDAGRPVLLNLAGHSIVGVGYDDATNLVYVHDTWDYNNHTMTWGTSYAGMALLSVSIVNLTASALPNPPSNLKATTTSSTQINLSWTDNSTQETGFLVERKTGASGVWSQIATLASNTTTYSSTGLIAATTYYYRVRASSLTGNSNYSNESNATTLGNKVLSSLAITGPSTVNESSTTNYTAKATYSDGSTATVTPTWSLSATTFATISAGGVLTTKAITSNQSVIVKASYTYLGVTKAISKSVAIVNVVPKTLTSLAISGAGSVNESSTSTYTAKATYSDGSTATVTPTWSLSATTFATISAGGVLTTKAVTSNQSVIVKASYTYRGITKVAAKTVAIINVQSIRLPLNDTGITECADGSPNYLPCPVNGYPEQDAQYGRDKTANDDSDGHAGFSFTKLDSNGNPLAASAKSWTCVRDNVTGLTWEVKTDNGGLRDKDWTYTWYNPDATTNGGGAGIQNGGTCAGSACDTQAFVQAVNSQGLCGARDWRLPPDRELMSIVSNDRIYPAIDADWFPYSQSLRFWSSSPWADYYDSAWLVYFSNGSVGWGFKGSAFYVRLVRG